MRKNQLSMSVDEQLRQAIRESSLSLNELGRRAGLDHGRLSRYLRGERDLTLAAVAKLCGVLGLHLSKQENVAAPVTDTVSNKTSKHTTTASAKSKKVVPVRDSNRSDD